MTNVLIFHAFKPQVSRNADHHPAFVAVYNMDTTEIVSFYQVHLFFILFYFLLGFYVLVCCVFSDSVLNLIRILQISFICCLSSSVTTFMQHQEI